MTECKFKVGEKYKTKHGVILTCLAIGKTRVFFEDFRGNAHTCFFNGAVYACWGDSDWDVLPEPIREPRKVEGFVWVKHMMADGPEDDYWVDTVFGENVYCYGTWEKAPSGSRKYKVTFVECSETETEEALPSEGPSAKREVVE